MYDRESAWRDVPIRDDEPQTDDSDYFADPTTLWPPIDANDDPDAEFFDRTYSAGFDDGYGIGRYESNLEKYGDD